MLQQGSSGVHYQSHDQQAAAAATATEATRQPAAARLEQ